MRVIWRRAAPIRGGAVAERRIDVAVSAVAAACRLALRERLEIAVGLTPRVDCAPRIHLCCGGGGAGEADNNGRDRASRHEMSDAHGCLRPVELVAILVIACQSHAALSIALTLVNPADRQARLNAAVGI